jgi:hypothetical protein
MRKIFTLSSHAFTTLLLLTSSFGYSQLTVNNGATATALANEIVGAGVTISNVSLQSATGGTGIFSNGAATNIGISNGILLTTGDAVDAIGPNNSGNISRDKTDFAADPDIDSLTNYSIKDQCILEFDFVAQSNYINVQYVFASEEYNEWVCTQYNDMFGFFVTGQNPNGGNYNGLNVALVPGTTLPVSINTINNGTAGSNGNPATCQSLAYSNLYQYNTPGATIGYDGFTVILTAELNIVPGQTYHFKFAIADLSDGLWDSGIFIKADSFSIFGCEAGDISFSSTPPVFCADDNVNDVVTVITNSLAPSDTYQYFITNNAGQILAINNSGTFDLANFGIGSFRIYGISSDGVVNGFAAGNNVSGISVSGNAGCFELTDPLSVARNNCNPIINCPTNVTLQCQSAVPTPNPMQVQVVSQLCAGGSVTWVSDAPQGSSCSGSISRVYQLTDNCGKTGQCQQTFTYNDTTAPVINSPGANATIQCGNVPSFTSPTASDNCGAAPAISIVTDVTTPGSCAGTYTRTMTWRASDACGNVSENVSQTITVIDTTSPVITGLPDNATINCSELPEGSDFAVMANDACDASVSITSSFTDVNVGCNKQRTITWTATDDCGNVSNASRVFNSSDNIAPSLIGVPPNATLQCGLPVPDAVVSSLDNCDPNPVVSMNATTVPAACGYSLVRTWTATDACGNTFSASQTTTFEDTTDPILVGVPDATSVNCGSVPDGEDFDVTATDNCVNEVNVTSSFVDAGSGCNVTRTITWTATDACGNSSSASRTFTLSDSSAPVLAGLPNDATVMCGALPEGDDYAVFANDNCDNAVTILFSHSDAASGCNVARTITWTATDDCGNSSSASRTFTSSDEVDPQLIGVPPNASLQCGLPVPDAVVSAIDNCDSEPVVSMNATTVPAACGYSLVRTWTATDACGNTTSASQTTTFVDTTDPILVGVPDATSVNCGSVPDGEDFDVTATDNCVNEVNVTSSFVDAGSGCNVTRTITWTATDACGNSSSASRTFTLSDSSAPVLAGLPNDATVMCGALPEGDDYAVFANDNCDNAVTILFSHSDAASGCNVARTITWTATDDCGNSSSASRTFTSSDEVDPQLIGVPPNASLQCGLPVPDAVVSAIDNCDSEPVVSMNATTVPAACGYSLVRTWTATDACGNTTSASQTTTFVDTTDPILVGLPTNSTVDCGAIPDGDDFNVTATDNCVNEVTITSSIADGGSGCNVTRTITWTATDACGNSSSASRTFTSNDNEDPILTGIPENGSVLCGGLPSTTEYNVNASDNCDQNVTIGVVANDVGSGCNVIRTITWTATDDCGNSTSATRTFTTQDNTPPNLIGVPADATMQCGEPVPAAVVSALDNCDTEPVVSMNATTVPAACGYSLVRTWTATDACGNTFSASQTTTFEDTTDPILVGVPDATSVNCGSVPDGEDFDVTATDNCVNEVNVTSSFVDAGSGCNVTRTITWTAADACGNSSSASRTFTLSDSSAPVLAGLPNDATVMCGALPEGDDYAVFANDNCDNAVTILFSHTDAASGCNVARTITWTATDDCGNSSSASRTFTSSDEVDPQLIGVPPNASLQCGLPVPDAVVSAIDNCDSEPVVSMNATTVPAACGYSLVRTWTATDACGNTTSASQTTTFVDTTDPILVGVPDATSVNCGSVPDGEDFDVTATDNCVNEVNVTSSFVDAGSGCNVTRTITWTATDACGNSSSASRTFTLSDSSAPVLAGLPNDATVMCGALPEGDDYAVFANDNCDNAVTILFSHSDAASGCNVARTITWTATDDCGNSSSASRTFTSSDEVDPQLIGVPPNASLQCGLPVPDAVVSAIDNCDSEPVVSMNATTVPAACGYSLVRTWTATDACGNTTSASQTTTFVDTTDPILVGLPTNSTVDCGAIPDGDDFNVTATDNCVNEVTITSSIADGGSGCNVTRTITWTATDACGNSSSASRTFTSNDNEDPILTGIPENGSVLCGGLPSTTEYNVNASDNCDQNVTIGVVANDVGSGCNVIRTITWTATDDCGNSTSATRTFTTQDNTPPNLIGVPADATMHCGEPVPAAVVSALDNCDTEPVVSMNATTVPAACGYSLVRTWTATDACGNTFSASQTTTFEDTTDPILVGVPDATSVNCGSVPDGEDFDVTATDNCVNEVNVTSSFVDAGSGCNVTRTITWTATDACGNSSSASRTFTLSDSSAPVLAGLPNDATVMCGALPEGDDYAVFANDNCDNAVTILFSHTDAASGCNVARTITWTATDDCGNSSSASRTFTSSDEVEPTLIGVPDDATLQCGLPVPVAQVSAVDNCSTNLNVSLSANTIPNECGYSLVRTWSVVDECGNTASASQTTLFIDTTIPVLHNVPQSMTVACVSLPTGDDYDVTATDNCDQNLAVTSSVIDSGNGCSILRTITWSATDACGNIATVSRTFSTSDLLAPIMNGLPANASVSCGDMPVGGNFAVLADDDCDASVSITSTLNDEQDGCNTIRTITWTATDDCGNSVSASRVFTSYDNEAPMLIGVPENTVLPIGASIPQAMVEAIDNCDFAPVITLEAVTTDNLCGETFTRTWTAYDACGNSTTATQTIEFANSTAPVLHNVPEESVVGCSALPTAESFEVYATDYQNEMVNVVSTTSDFGAGCGMFRTITWTATDGCGISSVESRIFSLSGDIPPVLIGVPSNQSINCTENIPDATVTALDQCDNNITVFMDEVMTVGCPYTITRTWSAVDGCGNETTATQIITVSDNEAPVINGVFEDLTYECDDIIDENEFVVSDNCDDEVEVSMTTVSEPYACGEIITRTWTARDECGNETSVSQMIYIVDETSPVFSTMPQNITVNCGSVPAPAELMATDNCDASVNITYSETNMGGGCPQMIKRIWTASDNCGNTTTAIQIVTVVDNTSPVFEEMSPIIQLECDQLDSYMPIATDNCTQNLVVNIINETSIPGECFGNIQRTYAVTDHCGNTTTATQTIEVVDNTPPVISNVPYTTVVQCGDNIPVVPTNIVAHDNCDPNVTVQFHEAQSGVECPYTITRMWVATDMCGNESVQTHVISVINPVSTQAYFRAYPNPAASGRMKIQFSVAYDTKVTGVIMDASGREVLTLINDTAMGAYVYEWSTELQKLAPGTYFVRMNVNGELYNKKIDIISR